MIQVFSAICSFCLIYVVISHGDDENRKKLFVVYNEGINGQILTIIKKHVSMPINIPKINNRESVLRALVTGCIVNTTDSTYSNPCSPVWVTLKNKKLKTASIGLPESLVLSFPWPSVIIGDAWFEIPFELSIDRLTEQVEHEEISLILLCIHDTNKTESYSFVQKLFTDHSFNIILINPAITEESTSSVTFKGPAFVDKIKFQLTLRTDEIYSLILGVFGVIDKQNNKNGNNLIASILKHHKVEKDVVTLIIIVALISVSATISSIAVVMSIKGVYARRQKLNRFNLGARLDPKSLRQPERNYLLDSSDDDELFSDPARDTRHSTVLRIHDNLSEITLH